ncbi:Ammonium transporter [Mycena sanguinolenta]|uniref:Ammonium transporter n=1 Tax=Mycena sanguinolenta TaxID=230812 RepID=A0A8H6YZD6_9AGAR|nr:Ammonium transporter [Mycena sanguinolenta]
MGGHSSSAVLLYISSSAARAISVYLGKRMGGGVHGLNGGSALSANLHAANACIIMTLPANMGGVPLSPPPSPRYSFPPRLPPILTSPPTDDPLLDHALHAHAPPARLRRAAPRWASGRTTVGLEQEIGVGSLTDGEDDLASG